MSENPFTPAALALLLELAEPIERHELTVGETMYVLAWLAGGELAGAPGDEAFAAGVARFCELAQDAARFRRERGF